MDRNKPGGSGSRGSKSKMNLPHHGSELYALGSKTSSSRDDSKNKVLSSSKTSSSSSSDRKRETSSSSMPVIPTKKAKLTSAIPSKPTETGSSSSSQSLVLEQWEQVAMECEPVDLVASILSAIDQQDSDTVVGLVCGAIKFVTSSRVKSDSILTLSLLYLARIRPHIFCNETIRSALESILKRDSAHSFKGRNNPTVHILAANLLARGYHDKKQWPESFLRIYIDDAVNERVWVDNEDCSSFVDNILTGFGTKVPPKWMLQPELNTLNPAARELDENDSDASSDVFKSSDSTSSDLPQRFAHMSSQVEKIVLDIIKEQLNRRQAQDCSTRNFLKFLAATSGLSEVRALAVTRLELWIHNGKLMKPAQELLTYLCYNVSGKCVKDQEVMGNLVKMRLKTKPLINIYMQCLKEMINQQPDILILMMKYVVQNELSNARNPNNMGMLANMFQTKPEASANHLAEIYQEFILQREDCLRTLRVFLRELVKMLRYDINLMVFCKAFITNRPEMIPQIQAFEFKERVFSSMVDLVCLCMFLSVSPQIREANSLLRSGKDTKGSTVLYHFYAQMSEIQCDALTWMHEVVPVVHKPTATDYTSSLHKILLLDTPDSYAKVDQWPPEPERTSMLRIVSEVPLNQDSILRLILIGITKEIPFTVPDTMEIIDNLVRRAGSVRNSDYPPLEANKLEIIDFLFSMAEYHHPENIVLPVGYEPPKLAISSLYWKTWTILLILSAHNPTSFGSFCWEQYPMLRNLMEMCITNFFVPQKMPDEELQVSAIEKTQILEFETYLAAATSKVVITETNSLLLSQLMLMDPMGVARRPSTVIMESLKTLNVTHKLGHLLCRSRKPDLLLDIIQRQGTSQSMPWLADLVQNSEGDFNHLPVQCLCEFLLSNSGIAIIENTRDAELLMYLQKLLQDETSDCTVTCEVLEYFLRRLSSTSNFSRQSAIKAIQLLLQCFHTDDPTVIDCPESDWLLRYLPTIPHFDAVRCIVNIQLRAACQIENCPDLIMLYIQFIADKTRDDPISEMLEHVMDLSQLIVERSTVFAHIIPQQQDDVESMFETNENQQRTLNCLFVMFTNFLINLREYKIPQSEYPDLLLVQFADGTQCHIYLNIIHAFVILLTNSAGILSAGQILDYWFPLNIPPPQAFHSETLEPVQILPDWLKLKMIRSSVERLVDAALQDLTPDQIVLFVQNFGTPVSSMSKLLALLDRAVIEQFEVVSAAILNKAYLTQLIEIQQVRGAKNGHISIQALGLHGVTAPSEESLAPQSTVEMIKPIDINIDAISKPPGFPEKQQGHTSKSKEIEEIIEMIFVPNTVPALTKPQQARFKKLMQQLVTKRDPHKSGSQKVSTQEYVATKTIHYLHRMTKSSPGIFLLQSLVQNSTLCTFFRSLLSWLPEKPEQCHYIVQVLDDCSKFINPKTNLMLLQIIANRRKTFVVTTTSNSKASSSKELARIGSLNTQDVLVDIFQSHKISEVEQKGKQVLNHLLRTTSSAHLIEAISSVLKMPMKMEAELDASSQLKSNKYGILVDWLAEADSELIRSNQNLQMDLLFNKDLQTFQPYLLSLLSHQSSWATLHSTIERLMDNYNPQYSSFSVLNFIDALMRNPKLWQGRDKSVPKHEQVERIILLSTSQIHVMIDYILNENDIKLTAADAKDNILMENSRKEETILSARVNLLLNCIERDTEVLKSVLTYCKNYESPKYDGVKVRFLRQLYLCIPNIKYLDADLPDVYDADLRNLNGSSVADQLTQYIITAVASLSNQRDWQAMSQDMELSIRKLAASHPSILLRQLSILAALIKGRAHMDMHVLRLEYHLSLFHQVMGILELLQPQIFLNIYQSGLHSALECYFTLMRHHGQTKEAFSILCRFMDFLQNYTNQNTGQALKFIEPYTELMQDLASFNRNLISLQQIVQGLSLLKHKNRTTLTDSVADGSENSRTIEQQPGTSAAALGEGTSSLVIAEIDTDSRGAAAVILAPFNKPDIAPQHWSALVQVFKKKSIIDDIMSPLNEIEYITFKKPALLDDVFDKLLELLFHSSPNVRTQAHNLLTRHLKNNPGVTTTNANSVTAYIQCLNNEDVGIVQSALETLTEMVYCLNEYAPQILQTVFQLGIKSKINTYNHIRKCVLALLTQNAC